MTKLTQPQKEMIADMLTRTYVSEDIERNIEKILGNAYGDKHTAAVFRELAEMRVKRFEE